MKVMIKIILALYLFLNALSGALGLEAKADEIHLKNGQKIEGTIVDQTPRSLILQSDVVGKLAVDRAIVQRYVVEEIKKGGKEDSFLEDEKKEPKVTAVKAKHKAVIQALDDWERKFSMGYSMTAGNSEASQLNMNLDLHKRSPADEWIIGWAHSFSSSQGKMDSRKFDGLIRYAYSFGQNLRWYHFAKMQGSQDRFADIDYRLVPSTGLGYWFKDQKDFKLMAETALGFQHTNYRKDKEAKNEFILIPRFFMEKHLLEGLHVNTSATFYPSLSDPGVYRSQYKAELTNAINDRSAMKFSFTKDYNSDPPEDVKRSDYAVVSSFEYSF